MEFRDEDFAVMRRYEERFGEDVPMAEMPGSPEAIVALLQECLDEGSTDPIDRLYPPGARS